MDNKKLKLFYLKYVQGKYLYRAFSSEWLPEIRKYGLNPKVNPYKKMKHSLIKFFKILDLLESRNCHYVYPYWPEEKPLGPKISRIHRRSLNKKYIDLTPIKKELDYYSQRKGGDIPHTANHITEDFVSHHYPLTSEQKKLVLKVQNWAKLRMKYSMKKLRVPATSVYLEKADFQRFGKEYIPCPLGSFKNFMRVVTKYGLQSYKPYLTGKKLYYVRLKSRVPATEIEFF